MMVCCNANLVETTCSRVF